MSHNFLSWSSNIPTIHIIYNTFTKPIRARHYMTALVGSTLLSLKQFTIKFINIYVYLFTFSYFYVHSQWWKDLYMAWPET